MAWGLFQKNDQSLIFQPKTEEEFFSLLLKKGLITPAQIEVLEKESARLQKSKREILVEKGLLSPENLALAYSLLFDIPLMHVPAGSVPENIINLISKTIAVQLEMVAFGVEEGYVKIGLVDPFRVLNNLSLLKEILVQQKIVPRFYIIPLTDFRQAILSYERRPLISRITLAGLEIPYQVLIKLPQKVAEKYQMVVFGYLPDELLKVGMVHPDDPKILEILDFIERRTGLGIEKYQISEDDLQYALSLYQKPPPQTAPLPPQTVSEGVSEKAPKEKPAKPTITIEKVVAPKEELAGLLKKDVVNVKELEGIVQSGHVPKIVAGIINFACYKKATDIHIQPFEKDLLIRYRIDGLLRDIIRLPKEIHPATISRIKILSGLKIDEQRIPQDGRFDLKFQGREVDIRVSTMPTVNGEKAVLRILDKTVGILTLEQLGLQGSGFRNLVKEIERPYGIILSTGPTGCGKSTTLYAIISRIKNPTVNIVTLEDPVEYKIEGINQSQIRPEINYSFATGLRSILRQDPDVIMVGEVRDTETASMAVHAALTGHLVLTTLHTNDAASALPRLINMGVEPFLITSAINAIIAQRLLRRICQKCQEEVKLSPAVVAEIEKEVEKIPESTLKEFKIKKPFVFRRGRGCDECDHGYKGRIGIFEVLVMSPTIEDLAVGKRPASEIQEAAQKEGMLTMKQDGILKVLQGLTTYDEVLRMISLE